MNGRWKFGSIVPPLNINNNNYSLWTIYSQGGKFYCTTHDKTCIDYDDYGKYEYYCGEKVFNYPLVVALNSDRQTYKKIKLEIKDKGSYILEDFLCSEWHYYFLDNFKVSKGDIYKIKLTPVQ